MIFSIITVARNDKKNLECTIQSVLSQTSTQIEYVVVDGNSTDGSKEVIQQYHSGITKWISENDTGIYDAMNKGLQLATSDYVWFLNAGDTLQTATTVENLEKVVQQYNFPDVVFGETDIVDQQRELLGQRRLKTPKKLDWKKFKWGMLVCHQAFVVKRSIAPTFDLKYKFSSDFDWCIKCLKKSKFIVNSKQRLVFYLYDGTTTNNRKKSLKERYYIMCQHYGKISTFVLHLWFAVRFYASKWLKGWT
jgi:glycosyltransferase involved in cell wall biosynthesis